MTTAVALAVRKRSKPEAEERMKNFKKLIFWILQPQSLKQSNRKRRLRNNVFAQSKSF